MSMTKVKCENEMLEQARYLVDGLHMSPVHT